MIRWKNLVRQAADGLVTAGMPGERSARCSHRLARSRKKRTTAGEVDLAAAPSSLRQALRFDDPERQLQDHTAAPHAGGRRAAVFHGHGVGTDDQKDNVLRSCQQLDRGLAPMLRVSAAPLVLAAVESVAAARAPRLAWSRRFERRRMAVSTWFVPLGVQRWGTFAEATRDVVLHDSPKAGDEDLLNVLAIVTLRDGGTVYAVAPADMPDGGEVAALLRY